LRDVTDRITTVGEIIATTYPALCGYVLQSRSQSCGFRTTPVYDSQQQTLTDSGSGLFVQRIHNCYPDLPLCNDTELNLDSAVEFLAQVRAYQHRPA